MCHCPHGLRPPLPATGVSRALRPKCLRGCPGECPRKPGVSHGVSPGPFGPRAPECPRSVPRDTPWDTPGDTLVFGDTLGDTPGDTSGPKGPRDPCSRPGGSQPMAQEYQSQSQKELLRELFLLPGYNYNDMNNPLRIVYEIITWTMAQSQGVVNHGFQTVVGDARRSRG